MYGSSTHNYRLMFTFIIENLENIQIINKYQPDFLKLGQIEFIEEEKRVIIWPAWIEGPILFMKHPHMCPSVESLLQTINCFYIWQFFA